MNTLKIAAALTLFALTPVAGQAADLMVQPKPMTVAAAAATTNWDGFYAGAQFGYGWGNLNYPSGGVSANLTGLAVGGQAGYNFHVSDNVVAGVEGDLRWNNQRGSFPTAVTSQINWDGSVRGRVGLDLGQVMPYVDAGVAFANGTINSGPGYSANHVGWTAGVGVEYMLASNLSANVEYRYSDYGTQTYSGQQFALTDSSLRVGLNYHF